jgi:cellulose synthase/poly-beta-1,6-N-acetylglucosamine synthase-like glycosyltransferase
MQHSNQCKNKTLCLEKLSLVLPETPPYVPRQFDRCAVIGNSGDLLKTKFGKEIDDYDVVIRENGAPIKVWFLFFYFFFFFFCQQSSCFSHLLNLVDMFFFFFFFVILLLQNYTEYVGKKSSFRLLNRGSAKALDKVVELDGMCTSLLLTMPFMYC